MRPVPDSVRHDGNGHARYDWAVATGVVYLLYCSRTRTHKVGASINPHHRIGQLVCDWSGGALELEYVWSIATNCLGRLESHWRTRWKPFRTRGREWLRLPEKEVREFRAVSAVLFADGPKPDPVWWECVNAPYSRPRGRGNWSE